MTELELDTIQKMIIKKLMAYNSEKVICVESYDFSVILSAINDVFIKLHEEREHA